MKGARAESASNYICCCPSGAAWVEKSNCFDGNRVGRSSQRIASSTSATNPLPTVSSLTHQPACA